LVVDVVAFANPPTVGGGAVFFVSTEVVFVAAVVTLVVTAGVVVTVVPGPVAVVEVSPTLVDVEDASVDGSVVAVDCEDEALCDLPPQAAVTSISVTTTPAMPDVRR
jgi:hypothetical protein